MTMLGMPTIPAVPAQRGAGPVAFTAGHHFAVTGAASVDELAEAATVPLSVILQVTKRCNFDLILTNGDRVLLALRNGTGYADGM